MVDMNDLRTKVKEVYRQVAQHPEGEYHFELGRPLAEKLGYDPRVLDAVPSSAVDSFAGVGHHFDYAAIKTGESILDLGSGSGMDSFIAAHKAGPNGKVVGLDMTNSQLEKAGKLRDDAGLSNISFKKGFIEEPPFQDESFDVVISNGVINLSYDKPRVFKEVSRMLKPRGRLAISDIVTEKEMPLQITCDADLWASCIGGAMQIDKYRRAIEDAGLKIIAVRENNQYKFLSESAQGASEEYGVKSITLLAKKP
jgi:ubiquinone/menaquinone biosynthesis C-methylase UbiE